MVSNLIVVNVFVELSVQNMQQHFDQPPFFQLGLIQPTKYLSFVNLLEKVNRFCTHPFFPKNNKRRQCCLVERTIFGQPQHNFTSKKSENFPRFQLNFKTTYFYQISLRNGLEAASWAKIQKS